MRTKININIKQITGIVFYLVTVAGCFVFPPTIEILICFLFIIYLMFRCHNLVVKGNGSGMSVLILLPVFLSCIQNLYLGLAVNNLQPFELQCLLTINILIAVALPTMRIIMTGQLHEYKWCIACIGGTLAYSLVLSVINSAPVTSFISCLRNILASFIFYYFGAVFGKNIKEKDFKKHILILIWIVVFFGFFEYIAGSGLWRKINISQLWNLKGIFTDPNGFPSNWYSSEVILGHPYVRRMVSSFADPVNLGTFLSAAFLLSWYYKKYVLMFFTLICCILTISKGALLGFLIFCVVFLWYKDKSRMGLTIALLGALAIGIAMLIYGAGSSTGLHVLMFFRSLKVLFKYPFGMGVGTIGVLAGVVGGISSDSYIMETGIGVVIAQLGFWGAAIYIYLFYKMFKIPKYMAKNERILLYTLVFSFLANAMFNEVALSPNSCALYFIILGIWSAKKKEKVTKYIEVENENTNLYA